MPNTNQSIRKITTRRWTLPLVAPFRVATRTSHDARNVLVRIDALDGLYGLGAAAPVEYVTGETEDTVLQSIATCSESLTSLAIDRLGPVLNIIGDFLGAEPSARAALEMAFYDLWAKYWRLPLWQYFGGHANSLTTDITIPIVTPEAASAIVRKASAEGFNLFKIKIGDSDGHDADLARIKAVTETAPGCMLRIDANQAFAPDDAVRFIASATRLSNNIQLVEQPVPKEDFAGLKHVKEHVKLPVFADESARSYSDVTKLISLGAVSGVNIKLMKSGISESADIARLCKRNGIKLMIGCMLESPLGIAAAAAMASGIGGFDFIDLDSHILLKPVECLTGALSMQGSQITLDGNSPGYGLHMSSLDQGTSCVD